MLRAFEKEKKTKTKYKQKQTTITTTNKSHVLLTGETATLI